jgi:hypothetical protein
LNLSAACGLMVIKVLRLRRRFCRQLNCRMP